MTRTSSTTPVASTAGRHDLHLLLTDDADALAGLSDDALRCLLTRVQGALLDRPGGTPALSVEVVTPREARLLHAIRRGAALRAHRRQGRLVRRSAARLTLARDTVCIAYEALRQKLVGTTAETGDSTARVAAEMRALVVLAAALRRASCTWRSSGPATMTGGSRA